MNSDNQNDQISRAARINFYGEKQIQTNHSTTHSSFYEKAFYGRDENWNNEQNLNTTTWD